MDTQVLLIDLKSNVTTKLGEPQGLYGLSWLADDKGLIVGKRIIRGKNEPSIETLCKMDLDGKLTEIREGKNRWCWATETPSCLKTRGGPGTFAIWTGKS